MQNGFHFTQSLQSGVDKLLGFVPEILGFILLIIIGWIIARLAKKLVRVLLHHLPFESSIALSPAAKYLKQVIPSPIEFAAKLTYWIIFLAFLGFAVSSLNVPALTLIVNGILAYIPNIIAAIIIFLVASAITVGAEAFVARVMGSGALSKILAAVVPAIIMPIAIFMILDQLHIAQRIVDITYAALVGSLALGLALAFGLGGRDVAARILEQAYSNAQNRAPQLKGEAREHARNIKRQTRRIGGNLSDQV